MNADEQIVLPELPFVLGDPQISRPIVVTQPQTPSSSAWEQVPNLGIKCMWIVGSHLIWVVVACLVAASLWGFFQSQRPSVLDRPAQNQRY